MQDVYVSSVHKASYDADKVGGQPLPELLGLYFVLFLT